MTARLSTVLSEEELAGILDRLAIEVSRDFPNGVLCVGVLKGCVIFLADLVRRLSVPCGIDFLGLSAYRPGDTRVKILKDLDLDVSGRDVLLVEDVVDTGLSAHYVLGLLAARGARRVEICTLINRPSRRILPLEPAYVGIAIDDEFLVGYGLDVAERYRNLRMLATGDPRELTDLHSELLVAGGGYQRARNAE